MEGIIRDYLGRFSSIKPSDKVGRNINKLRLHICGPVPITITDHLRAAHRRREKIHLHLCKNELEYGKYKKDDYYKTKDTILEFIDWIKDNV
jgi:hypothetical protein